MIREMRADDLPSVVALHRKCLTNSVLARFGERFLHVLYRSYLESGVSVNLVVEDEGMVKAFISVTTDLDGQSAYTFERYAWRLARALLPAILRRPWLVYRAVESFRYRKKAGLPGVEAEMLFIAVEPELRKRGVATDLIGEALRRMAARGVREVKVSTDRDNAPVNALLARLGFAVRREFTFHGKRMNLHTARLTPRGEVIR